MPEPTKEPITGSFGANGSSDMFVTRAGFNMSLSGFGSATVILQRSFDRGVTWKNVENFTADAERRVDDPEKNVYYRLTCTGYGSGTIAYRLSS